MKSTAPSIRCSDTVAATHRARVAYGSGKIKCGHAVRRAGLNDLLGAKRAAERIAEFRLVSIQCDELIGEECLRIRINERLRPIGSREQRKVFVDLRTLAVALLMQPLEKCFQRRVIEHECHVFTLEIGFS
jgi:hypothetical protein